MGFRFIAFSDIHLNQGDDYDLKPLEEEIGSREEDREIDALMVLGDTVDNIPRDRMSEGDLKRDIETGRGFFRDLSGLAERQGTPTYAVPGNHDYDIFEDIICSAEDEPLPGIRDGTEPWVHGEGDEKYGVVGADISRFDIGPEVKPSIYGIENNEKLVNVMWKVGQGEMSIEQAGDIFDLEGNLYADFHGDSKRFIEEYRDLAQDFEEVYEVVSEEDTVFLSHIAPFGTDLDAKEIGREKQEHAGSLVNRALIDYFRPRLALNGHHDYHTLQYFPSENSYSSDMYAVGLDEAAPLEMEITDGGLSVEQKY